MVLNRCLLLGSWTLTSYYFHLKWWLLSWLLHKQKIEFSDTNVSSENLSDILTECFSHHQGESSDLSWYQRTLFSDYVLFLLSYVWLILSIHCIDFFCSINVCCILIFLVLKAHLWC